MITDSTMPCYKYLARSVETEDAQLELARAFISNFESNGFSREDTLYRYSTLSHYTIGKQNVVPIYSYHGTILPAEEYAEKVMSDKNIKKRRSCQSYCKSVNKGFATLCKLCPLSEEYSNTYIEREYELLRYIAQSADNLLKFMKIADRMVFRSYVDFASDIAVDKPAVVPLLKEIYHLISQRGNAFYMTDGSISERFTQIRQAVVMSFCDDYPGFKEVLAVNPRVLNVMWKITVENIVNSTNLSDDDVVQVVNNIKEGIKEPSDNTVEGEYSIFELFESATSDDDAPDLDEDIADGEPEIMSDISEDESAEPEFKDMVSNDESSDEPSVNVEQQEQSVKAPAPVVSSEPEQNSDGLFVPEDDPDEGKLPFKEDSDDEDDVAEISVPDTDDNPQPEKTGASDVAKKAEKKASSSGEIMESSMMTLPDDEDEPPSFKEKPEDADDGTVTDDAGSKQPQSEESDAAAEPTEGAEGENEGNAVSVVTDVKTDFEPKGKVEVNVKLDRSPLIYTPCINEAALKTLFYPYLSCEKEAMVSILKRRCLPLEVIFTEKGIPYYLMWVSGISKYLIVEAFHIPQSLETIFKHNSVVKIVYQPYYLYSLLRLAGIRPKNIYSIFSVDLMLHPVAMPSDYGHLMMMYLKDCGYLYKVSCGLSWLDDQLVSMQGYDYAYSVQTRTITRNSLDEYTRVMLRDEVLGTSFMRSVFLNDDGYLFDYDADGFISFSQEYTLSVKKSGFLVTYSISSEDLEPVQSRKLFMDSLVELAYKGKIRKFDLYLITMSDNLMSVFVDLRCYEVLTTLLQNFFNKYALAHKLEHFELVADHRRLDPEGVDFTPVRINLPEKMSDVLDTLITTNAKVTVPESRIRGPQKAVISKAKKIGNPFTSK